MWGAKKSEHPHVARADPLASALGMHGVYHDAASRRDVHWRVHRTPAGLLAFGGIGVLAGMFGLGAGWANVPALNLLMRAAQLRSAPRGLASCGYVAAWVSNPRRVRPRRVAPSILG